MSVTAPDIYSLKVVSPNGSLQKQIRKDGENFAIARARPVGTRFTYAPLETDTAGDWLRELSEDPTRCVVLGEPVQGWDPAEPRQRTQQNLISEQGILWLPLDLDQYDAPDVLEGDALAAQIMEHLGLVGTHCVWQLTGSHGIGGKNKIRLWIPLRKRVALATAKDWVKSTMEKANTPIDMSLYAPEHVIYTANPKVTGAPDPWEGRRIGIIIGELLTIGSAPRKAAAKTGGKKDKGDDDLQILDRLKELGLYKGEIKPGIHDITCPWLKSHSHDDDTGTRFMEASDQMIDSFKCHHDSCKDRGFGQFLTAIGFSVFGDAYVSKEASDERDLQGMQPPMWEFCFLKARNRFYRFASCTLMDPMTYTMYRISSAYEGGGRPPKNPVMAALRSSDFPRAFDTIFEPGASRFVERKESGATFLNTFVDRRVVDPKGDAKPWLDHIESMIPDEDSREWLLDWMGYVYQNPGKRALVMPILISRMQGTGKTTIVNIFADTIDPSKYKSASYISTVKADSLAKEFNGFAGGKLLIIAEELKSHDRHDMVNALKPLITNNTIAIERKGIDATTSENYLNLIGMSNHFDAVSIDDGDRRFVPILCAEDKALMGSAEKLNRWFEEAGSDGIAAFLKARKVGNLRKIPDAVTELKSDINASTRSFDDHAADLIRDALKLTKCDAITTGMMKVIFAREKFDVRTSKYGQIMRHLSDFTKKQARYGRGESMWVRDGSVTPDYVELKKRFAAAFDFADDD